MLKCRCWFDSHNDNTTAITDNGKCYKKMTLKTNFKFNIIHYQYESVEYIRPHRRYVFKIVPRYPVLPCRVSLVVDKFFKLLTYEVIFGFLKPTFTYVK